MPDAVPEWRRIVGVLAERGTLTTEDVPMVRSACETALLALRWRQMADEMLAQGDLKEAGKATICAATCHGQYMKTMKLLRLVECDREQFMTDGEQGGPGVAIKAFLATAKPARAN